VTCCVSVSINRTVKMGTVRGLRGQTDGRARQVPIHQLRARIDGSGGGGGVAYKDGRASGYKQGWADGRAGRRTAQIESKSRYT